MAEKDMHTDGTPRWVKVFGIVAVAVLLVVIVMLVSGRGGHGPGRHTDDDAPPAGTVIGNHRAL
jgi:hypothetical protein